MDQLKSAWQAMPGGNKKQAELRNMLQEGHHPVLKDLRRQILIESIFFSVFLACYYTMFDGDRKPFFVNALLVGGLLLIIGHGLLGYFHAKQSVAADNLRQALLLRVQQLKSFAVVSVSFRLLGVLGILLFFTYTIQFTMEKQVILMGLFVFMLIQFVLLVRLWLRRIARLREAEADLSDQ